MSRSISLGVAFIFNWLTLSCTSSFILAGPMIGFDRIPPEIDHFTAVGLGAHSTTEVIVDYQGHRALVVIANACPFEIHDERSYAVWTALNHLVSGEELSIDVVERRQDGHPICNITVNGVDIGEELQRLRHSPR